MKRLAPADYKAAVSASAERRSRSRKGIAHDASERAIRDGDLHAIFKPGRELTFLGGYGEVLETRPLRPAEAKNAKVLMGVVKLIAAAQPQKVIRDNTLVEKLGGKSAGWSLATVRRTRRVCAAAGIVVRPVVSDGAGEASPEFTGFVWVLDRRLVPCLSAGVVTGDDLLRVHERENLGDEVAPPSKPADGGERGPPDPLVAGEGERLTVAERSALQTPAPREPTSETPPGRSWSRALRRRRGEEDAVPADVDVGAEVELLGRLVAERWKMRDEWGIAAAIADAELAALERGADPHRIAVARRRFAFELLGEQLAINDGGGSS